MARTVNPEAHQVRRDAFLDVAQRLIMTRGYERMSIQEVLEALEASKGALYHYFDSKQALLDGVVERMADEAMRSIAPILADPALPALRRLEKVFSGLAAFKAERKELVLAIMVVWMSDGNALVREKVRRLTAERLQPLLVRIIKQGMNEGTVSVSSAEDTARVLTFVMEGFQELAGEHLRARHAGAITFEEVVRSFASTTEAFERILGVPHGSVKVLNEAVLREWFG